MIIRTIEMLLEYICIIGCIYKTAGKKIEMNKWLALIFLVEWSTIIIADCEMVSGIGKALVYVFLLFYIKNKVTDSWERAMKVYGNMILTIVVLQIMLYLGLTLIFEDIRYSGIYINAMSCLLIFAVKEKFEKKVAVKFGNIKGLFLILVIYSLSLFRVFWISYKNGYIDTEESVQFIVETIVLSISLILWFDAERSNRQREKEIQMYEMYNQAFEETIATIRARQHEFENHINAIRCMGYTIEDKKRLLEEQEKYCNEVIKDSKISSLLKLKMEPVLIGFLYAKIMTLKAEGIHVEYEINAIEVKGRIKIHEIIEVIGILLDNAVEALQEREEKVIRLHIKKTENGFLVEVANISRIYLNREIEEFCKFGYSTKGEKRGVGLSRVKEIVNKARATMLIQNREYEDRNYLCFEITVEY